MRESGLLDNNFVGKRKETYKIVGSGSVDPRIDSKFFNAVRDNPLGGLEKPGGLGHASPRIFKSVNDQLSFKIPHGPLIGKGGDRI